MVATTPESSCSRATSSLPNRTPPGLSSSARCFNRGSSRICGRLACRQGDAATHAGSAPPPSQHSILEISRPAKSLPATSRYQAVWLMFSRGVPAWYTRCAQPTSRSTSIARCCSTCALGSTDVVGIALTTRCSTPYVDSSIEAVNPAPPPPTTRTGTWTSICLLYTSDAADDLLCVDLG